jgi:16S rRNA (guanine(966)-N(2))-methyltransferase RsmD
LRETLFNILAPQIEGARFLDLCAGTGAVGIEALSRGASHATFVDQSPKMCELIEINLTSMEIAPGDYQVVRADAGEYLRRHLKKEEQQLGIVFFDPPYATDYEELLNFIGEHAAKILDAEGLVIVEHHKKKSLEDQFKALTRYREVKQGDSALSFYRAT